MRHALSVGFTLLALMAALPLLAACHTTEGLGQDVSATGHVVSHDAQKLTP
jgi:predicted small secreted protein